MVTVRVRVVPAPGEGRSVDMRAPSSAASLKGQRRCNRRLRRRLAQAPEATTGPGFAPGGTKPPRAARRAVRRCGYPGALGPCQRSILTVLASSSLVVAIGG
eukprot:scaffold54286_cov51-Phaeocystis_antarctica.AAC.1